MKPFRFATRLRLAFLASLLVVVLSAMAAAWWLPSPWAVLIAGLGVGLPLGWWLLDRILGPASRVLQSLRDGVRGFRERDFSLNLAVDRRDELGELVELYNSVGDVLRDERSAIVQREILLETVLEATPTAIVLTSGRDRVVFANRAAHEVFLRAAGSKDGSSARSWRSVRKGCAKLWLAAATRCSRWRAAARRRSSTSPAGPSSSTAGSHGLTLIKRLTPELRRQEVDVWKRAIRTLSHEINNSLAPIASLARSVRLMARNPEHAKGFDEALDVIEERSTHLKEFLEGYARFARLPQPNERQVDWQAFLAELRQVVPFDLEGDPPTVPGRFDPGQVQQALINLLKNAHESGGPPAEVKLAVDALGGAGVRFRVLDRGGGMTDEVMRKALLPFYTSKPGGSGLGLPLCREIVEAHGGRLRIERREGGGTAVVCWVPG